MIVIITCIALIVARWVVQMTLEALNQRHVRHSAGAVPPAFAGVVPPETYEKSVKYTLAKSRFEMFEVTWNAIVIGLVLCSGMLPWFYRIFQGRFGESPWAGAAFLLTSWVILSLADLPLEWHAQFHLEEQFGFNTTSAATWWADRIKGLFLTVALGFPLLGLILRMTVWVGAAWWFWGWVCLALFQLVMMLIAPVLILPLFNKFTPLPEGPLRDGLLALGRRAGFRARDIQVMDGSRRSRHSNAFFTGLGRFRKIVLFDTLIQQLTGEELESVLAHEIGHYKKGHVPKMIALTILGSLPVFYLVAVLAKTAWFMDPFGFAEGGIVPAFLLLSLLSGLLTFWISPFFHLLSRRHEYEADSFAAHLINRTQPLVSALRKLNEKNLSNLTPHPFYSGFYYSHPTLIEREKALERFVPQTI